MNQTIFPTTSASDRVTILEKLSISNFKSLFNNYKIFYFNSTHHFRLWYSQIITGYTDSNEGIF